VRVLIGPLNRVEGAVGRGLAGLDALCFDRAGADVDFEPATEPLEALWARLPAGWRPDCLIWWSPEYSLLPEGIDRCPVPSIAVLGDWNLGCWTTAPLLEAFDWVVTDRLGVLALRSQLGVPVDYWPAFSFDPAVHRPRPEIARDIDVLFVGNTNPDVQVERARWLGRLAALSSRHRVVLASGVYGEAYGELLARARIVWNRSIRGELNMRAYEAPAAGALLLMEEDNLEVRDLFADGASCALYGAANLETVIDRYLDDPARLARVAEAGRQRVQEQTYGRHLERLLAAARPLPRGPRPFAGLPAWRRDYWLGVHALCTADPRRLAAALTCLQRAAAASPDPTAVAPALGVVAALAAADAAPADRDYRLGVATRLLGAGLATHPDDVVTRAALAWLLGLGGAADDARRHWQTAHAQLGAGAPFPVDRVPLPFVFDRFRVEWERAAQAADLDARMGQFRPLLQARVAAELAALEEAADPARPDGSVAWLVESVRAWPGIGGNLQRLAERLEAAGDPAGAAAGFARVLEGNPFDRDARRAAVRLAAAQGEGETVARLLAEARDIAAAAPEQVDLVTDMEALAVPAGSLHS